MSFKIYAGNLNYQTTEDTLRQLFEQYGEVESVKIITDRDSGFSKGFGFVEMASEEAGEAAISALNQHEVDGRQLRVNKAHERGGRSSFGGDRSRGSSYRYY
ncbi:RNA recognition motif domain-containing protein [Spirochaeta thermophila]|uniref:RNP-1 like RNA-binding protein n=2 Tax=Winmispira thermophila TaxID=154 RepID=G0GB87_WINT7|nr:RNA-binding protein [Spirochaeta thermophila]ADN02524.1 RNA-binding region RNP-1 [Spirochaeta thermophila DSM 6192]AEJ61896.1 RNP-1 like RNA-binding protein [Spirochaeta thermophila DSM 6578]